MWTDLDEIWNNVTMYATCGGLALADFGRDPRSNDSLRGIIFSKKTQKLLTKFLVLRLQAVITPQWLQMLKIHGQMAPLWDV